MLGTVPSRILVIDDDPAVGALYRAALELDGFSVTVTSNGHDGIQQILESRPHLVILDILMPVMDGWEVLGRLRTLEAPPPVIVATAAEVSSRALAAGATAWYSKATSLSLLREACRRLLDGN
ncbi:MAG TPA: response regulator [Vicinamibacteria bacterium]|jgi:CheY-like chemotaxis protein|nr:response regulator [Vicinamibacteria bacterium]